MTYVTDGLTAALADRYRIERQLGEGGMATGRRFLMLRRPADRAARDDQLYVVENFFEELKRKARR